MTELTVSHACVDQMDKAPCREMSFVRRRTLNRECGEVLKVCDSSGAEVAVGQIVKVWSGCLSSRAAVRQQADQTGFADLQQLQDVHTRVSTQRKRRRGSSE